MEAQWLWAGDNRAWLLLLGVRIPAKKHQSALLHCYTRDEEVGGDQIGAKDDDAYLSTR